jgi:hypothetical protein
MRQEESNIHDSNMLDICMHSTGWPKARAQRGHVRNIWSEPIVDVLEKDQETARAIESLSFTSSLFVLPHERHLCLRARNACVTHA